MNMSLKIGLDFDGVFSDCTALKERVANELHDRSYDVLDPEEKDEVRTTAYGTRKYGRGMEPIQDAFKYVTKLHEAGHDITIITSRDGRFLDVAKQWYDEQCERSQYDVPELEFVGVGYPGSKAPACKDAAVDVFVDDDLDKLEHLVEDVPHRYHFVGAYETETDPDVAEPVKGWAELYDAMNELTH